MQVFVAVLASIHVRAKAHVLRGKGEDSPPHPPPLPPPSDTPFHSVSQWIRKQGASVNSHLQGGFRNHGGVSIRSVIGTEAFSNGTVLMSIPRNVWIWEGSPAWSDLVAQKEAVSQIPSCKELDPTDLLKLIVAVGMAREKEKGEASTISMALNSWPTYDDYYSFHPRLAGWEILRDFSSLDLVGYIKVEQIGDREKQQCFLAWKSKSPSIAGIEWLNVFEALEQIYTRSFAGPEELKNSFVLVPLADMLNTVPGAKFNVRWHFDKETFFMTSNGSPANTELNTGYCSMCENEYMLAKWGMYLENNPNKPLLRCQPYMVADKVLFDATMAALETHKEPAWTAPRCKAAVLETPQGPMRCYLARLSWEICGDRWVGNATIGASFHGLSLKSKKAANKRAVMQAKLLDQTYMDQVHRAPLTAFSHV